MSRPMTASINASSRLGNTRNRPASTNSRRSIKVVLRSAQPWAAAANAASPSVAFAVIKTISIQESSFGTLSSKPMPLRIEHEYEWNQEGRQRVLPSLQRGLIRIAAGDRGGCERRQRRRRRYLRQHRVIENEHVGGVVGHAELDHGGRRDDRADDVGGGHWHRQADDPDDQRGVGRGQQQAAAGVVDYDRGELQPQPGQRDHADDDAGGRKWWR